MEASGVEVLANRLTYEDGDLNWAASVANNALQLKC
jgi:hypothetical protein